MEYVNVYQMSSIKIVLNVLTTFGVRFLMKAVENAAAISQV